VQGGLVQRADAERLYTLGSLFYEPIWIFYRGKATVERVSELRGLRVAIGIPGGGTHVLGLAVARDNGLGEPPTTLVELGGLAAAEALIDGRIDAALYVSAIDGPAVQRLLRTPGVRMMDARRADAYVRRLPYLHKLDLPEGVVDLKAGIPPQRMTIIAVTGNLVARDELHPVAVELLLQPRARCMADPHCCTRPVSFRRRWTWNCLSTPTPSASTRSVLRCCVACCRFARGVVRAMAIHSAAAARRGGPGIRLPAKIYDWRIRSKLDGWYVEVNRIERVAAERGENAAAQLARMNEIDSRLNRVKVPKAYLAQLYTLRQHADYVRGLLLARQGEVGSS